MSLAHTKQMSIMKDFNLILAIVTVALTSVFGFTSGHNIIEPSSFCDHFMDFISNISVEEPDCVLDYVVGFIRGAAKSFIDLF